MFEWAKTFFILKVTSIGTFQVQNHFSVILGRQDLSHIHRGIRFQEFVCESIIQFQGNESLLYQN